MTTMKTTPAFAFVGKQNSGKTVLLEKLIAALTEQGVRVASIKHHSHVGFEFDVNGKDSWRHRRAGSTHTIIASPDQIASVRLLPNGAQVEVEQLIEALLYESQVFGHMPEIILVEGYRYGGLPIVELFRADNPQDAQRDLCTEGNNVVAVITDIPRVAAQAASLGIPGFGFEDIAAICCYLRGL